MSLFSIRKSAVNVGVVVITILFLRSDLVTEATTGVWIPFTKKALLRVFLRARGEKVKVESLA